MLKVNSHYLSRSQWLQLLNPTARRRIEGGTGKADLTQPPGILGVVPSLQSIAIRRRITISPLQRSVHVRFQSAPNMTRSDAE